MGNSKGSVVFKCALWLAFIFFSYNTFSQQDDVSFLINTIKRDYAGYRDKTTDKTFNKFTSAVVVKYKADTFKILSVIVDYFKDPHLKVYGYPILKIDSPIYKRRLLEINNYLRHANQTLNKYEGYWLNDRGTCLVGLRLVSKRSGRYESVVIESEHLSQGMINAVFERKKDHSFLTEYYTPSSGYHIYLIAEFKNDSVFTIGPYSMWKKLGASNKPLTYLNQYNDRVRGGLIDKENYLITIPINSEENTKILDSLVKADYLLIGSTKNLIIDIRNNLGGTVRTYAPLFPFIYTNPIQKISGYKYYSKTLLESYESDLMQYRLENPLDTALIKKKEEYLGNLKKNVGKIIIDTGSLIKLDSIRAYPQNVAIIANFGCLSASEMMILDFKQSKKVTLFGEQTFGGVDFLDNYDLDLPSKKYQLSIASLKRIIPKGAKKIDGIGIYPDVTIPLQESDWVQFVQRYYRKICLGR